MVGYRIFFLLKRDSGFIVLFIADLLSQNAFAGPSNGTPIIRTLYLRVISFSVAILSTTYSEPKIELSHVFFFFEYLNIGAIHRKIRIPVCDQRVTLFSEWSAST